MITRVITRSVDFNDKDENIKEDYSVKIYLGYDKARIKVWEHDFKYKANDTKTSGRQVGFKSNQDDSRRT